MRVVIPAIFAVHGRWTFDRALAGIGAAAAFARDLHATFTVATGPTVDPDWMFDDPELFAQHLCALRLRVLSG